MVVAGPVSVETGAKVFAGREVVLPVPSTDVAPGYVVGFVGRTTFVPLPVGTETIGVREAPVPIGAVVTGSRVFAEVTTPFVDGVETPEVVGLSDRTGPRAALEVVVPV